MGAAAKDALLHGGWARDGNMAGEDVQRLQDRDIEREHRQAPSAHASTRRASRSGPGATITIGQRQKARLACTALVLLVILCTARQADAAEREDYQIASFPGTPCVSGQADQRGVLYVSCQQRLRLFSAAGRDLGFASGKLGVVTDVAPSPDGAFVYYGGVAIQLSRLKRLPSGKYAPDRAFRASHFRIDSKWQSPYVSHLATDAFGNIYVSDGGWTRNILNMVIKYTPDGKVDTMFGGYTAGNIHKRDARGVYLDDRLWQKGLFFWMLQGVAASRDGRRVYTTEVGNNRVTRWDWQADGSYKATLTFGGSKATDPTREGSCSLGHLAAPYDVVVDAWGFVYVASATCTSVQKYTAAGGFVWGGYDGTSGMRGPGVNGGGGTQKSHTLAVDAGGGIWSGETGYRLVRPASSTPGPVPKITRPIADRAAPVLKVVRVAKETKLEKPAAEASAGTQTAGTGAASASAAPSSKDGATGQTLAAPPIAGQASTEPAGIAHLHMVATDDVGVAQVRFATESGDWTAWRPWAPSMSFRLQPGAGWHGVSVQVRDRVGHESKVAYVKTQVVDPATASISMGHVNWRKIGAVLLLVLVLGLVAAALLRHGRRRGPRSGGA
jgi:hypothetical protein